MSFENFYDCVLDLAFEMKVFSSSKFIDGCFGGNCFLDVYSTSDIFISKIISIVKDNNFNFQKINGGIRILSF